MTTAAADERSTHDRILHAAQHAFARHGFEGTRLADIAKDVGIRRPSLLYWFATKQALYARVVQTAFAALEDALTNALDDNRPLIQRVDRAADALHSFFDDAPHIAALIVHELSRQEGPGQAILLDRVIPLLTAIEMRLADDRGRTLAGVPFRSAVLTVVGGLLLRSATSPGVRDGLWGAHDVSVTRSIARSVFLPTEVVP